MASSSGNETAVPRPRSTVRLEIAFFVTIMSISSSVNRGGAPPPPSVPSPLRGSALVAASICLVCPRIHRDTRRLCLRPRVHRHTYRLCLGRFTRLGFGWIVDLLG